MEIRDLKRVTENVLDMFNSRYEMPPTPKTGKLNIPNFIKHYYSTDPGSSTNLT